MDARIDPALAFGIALGDAHIIRNAGGNAQDALRSILTSQHLLGTREIVLVKHTGCGMLTFSNDDAKAALRGNGGRVEDDFDFRPFTDLEGALKRDVEFLRGHEGLAKDVPVSGWVYDVGSGRVGRVV
jgi:carbonic anhydrase